MILQVWGDSTAGTCRDAGGAQQNHYFRRWVFLTLRKETESAWIYLNHGCPRQIRRISSLFRPVYPNMVVPWGRRFISHAPSCLVKLVCWIGRFVLAELRENKDIASWPTFLDPCYLHLVGSWGLSGLMQQSLFASGAACGEHQWLGIGARLPEAAWWWGGGDPSCAVRWPGVGVCLYQVWLEFWTAPP